MPERSNPKSPWFYIRLLVSMLLLAWVLYKAGLGQLWEALQHTRLNMLLLSLAVTPVLILISAWKWQVILRAFSIRVSLAHCFWLYIVGYFFNTVLPTNVGGDVVRAYTLGKESNERAKVFSSVFVERFTGLSALLLMAVIAFAAAVRHLWDAWLPVALSLCLCGYGVLLLTILKRSILDWFTRHIRFSAAQSVFAKLKKFQDATLSLSNSPGTLWFAMFNSFFFYLAAVTNVYISSLAFSVAISYTDALIITPIVMIITMIPISIGGIGLAESAYFFTFERLQLSGPAGLSVALLLRAKALLAGLIGGLYFSGMDITLDTFKGDGMKHEIAKGDIKGEVDYYSGFEDVMRRRQSPLSKYMDITLGARNLWELIKYETVMLFWAPLPGLAGYAGRRLFLPALFRSFGKKTAVGRNVTLQHASKISIGTRCMIDEYCKLSAQGDAESEIVLGSDVLLGRGTTLGTRNGRIEIGDFCNIGANCRMGTTTRIILGKHAPFAANCYIGGAQHRFDRLNVPIMRQGYDSKGGVIIEDDVWLGAGVTVLDGVTIGTGSVIGAGSVVTKDIPPYSVAIGAPARIKSTRK
ncbi:MAG: flippase-like domain-containing protein [candidate division KSB1 bacterium]|nr:flippase-like domain-containing protein [candidate division KSB1 bacterium]